MNRLSLLLSTLLLAGGLGAQTTVKLTVNATGCKAPLKVYVFDGYSFAPVQTMQVGENNSYTTELTVTEPTFRYVGSAPNDALPLIFGGEPSFTLTGRCGAMRNATTTGSPLNEGYTKLKRSFQEHQTEYAGLVRDMQQAANDDVVLEEKQQSLIDLDRRKQELVVSAKDQHPILGRVASLNTYLSYQAADQEKFQNEIDYYVNSYFQFVDFKDRGYDELPWTYEGNRNFATNLTQVLPGEELTDLLLNVYGLWPAGSRAQFLAMSGGFAALAQRKHPGAPALAERIQKTFATAFPGPVASIAKQARSIRSFAAGSEAPLFAGPTPEGDTVSLEGLRGKVVLIDFWASWCGPCRRENPNVVKVYNEYKDRGFEILGVSLDKTKDRWVKAIEADKLSWLHVSDLKGWQSAYGRLYGVTSIPQTVLLDREGKIIARNLRGKALENKLKEVFSVKK